jgi:hypothetical protein
MGWFVLGFFSIGIVIWIIEEIKKSALRTQRLEQEQLEKEAFDKITTEQGFNIENTQKYLDSIKDFTSQIKRKSEEFHTLKDNPVLKFVGFISHKYCKKHKQRYNFIFRNKRHYLGCYGCYTDYVEKKLR